LLFIQSLAIDYLLVSTFDLNTSEYIIDTLATIIGWLRQLQILHKAIVIALVLAHWNIEHYHTAEYHTLNNTH